MKIELHEITIREITNGYVDNGEAGIVGYSGRLNIRPPYQREFIYDDAKRNAVMDTINKGYPLNVMYWVKNEDGNYEIMDGQQRTISFCKYVNSEFSLNNKFFHNLTTAEKEKILNYKCMIYICEGTDFEKLEWFKTINIAGEKLTDQELRNAVYTGPWLSDAKLKFSKTNCAAYLLSKDYVNGNPIRQELLERAISWINGGDIDGYMAIHQHDPNANELWFYFKNVIDWVQLTFPHYRKEMKGIDWASLYNAYHNTTLDTTKLEEEISELMLDDDVTNKKGIYPYVLDRNEKHLNIREFTPNQKREAYERQGGICPRCVSLHKPTATKVWKIEEMEADHIKPWHEGGKTDSANCQMLCRQCNREKGGR
jgi:hypothetical protein